MRALAGCWSFQPSGPNPELRLPAMLGAQPVFGATSVDLERRGAFGVGVRHRLAQDSPPASVILTGAGGALLLAADIRLDNRDEVGADLGLGREAAALSDAALLMRAWERWGVAALDRLAGAFAFALWDAPNERLLLVRDPQGHRPLHYHPGPRFAAFASMPSGLHALDAIERRLDPETLARFLDLAPPAESRTFFAGIAQAPAGHMVTITRSGVRTTRYWSPSLEPLRLKTPGDYVEAIRERFDAAIRAALRGGGSRVGAHLSAGLDSGGVAASAARLLPGGEVTGFTAVPRPDLANGGGAIVDEGPLAGETAAMYPNLTQVLVRAVGPLATLDDGPDLYGRPLPNPCNYGWGRAILDEARARGIGVLLTGQMGNLTFSHDGADLLPRLLRSGRWLRLAGEARALGRAGMATRGLIGSTIGPLLGARAWRGVSALLGRPRSRASFSLARQGAWMISGTDYSQQPTLDAAQARLAALERLDFGSFNAGMAAGWGIDLRDPTADRRLIELCLRIPPDQFLRGGVRRALARRVLADRLPPAVLDETRRGRQSADWHLALDEARPQVLEEVRLIERSPEASEVIDTVRLRTLVETWPTRWDGSAGQEALYRGALLRALSAGRFARSLERRALQIDGSAPEEGSASHPLDGVSQPR